LEVRKRVLLLMGPVGGGKSTIVYLIKRGLEAYSRTEVGAIYAIRDCPMHEEPLHLIPIDLRSDVEKEFNIYIEGDLCPHCRYMVDTQYKGHIEDVPVKRLAFSEKYRVGVGTFTPSDPKSQDISELVGGIDLSTIGEVGVESDPRAYRFDGELNIANRGIMEFVEMLKTDEKFLYVLLTLSQEQNIKTGRFSMIYADEVVVSHTNEHEYQAFVGNKKSEALQDRIILAKVPYNLRASDEVKIYEKLLKQSALQNVHIAPYTLRIASVFAILTRLEPSKKAGMSLMKKLKLYDGEDIEDFKQKDIKELQEEAVREGMDGISPRYVINRLSNALVKQNTTCINPIDALRALRDGLDQHTSITREEREHYLNFISEARKEYDEMAKKEVQRAFVYSYEESARTLLNNYLDNVEAYCNKTKLRDPITDEEMEPDEQLMRSIEEQIGVTENAKKSFREEILIRISSLARKGMTFEYTSHERLKEAIEKKLFADLRDVVKITTSARTPDKEQLRKINDVVNRLMTEHGYCHVCANEILRYTGSLLNR
jgi:serine protein kinase